MGAGTCLVLMAKADGSPSTPTGIACWRCCRSRRGRRSRRPCSRRSGTGIAATRPWPTGGWCSPTCPGSPIPPTRVACNRRRRCSTGASRPRPAEGTRSRGIDFTRGHYDSAQPRVPAGNGRESGRWDDEAGGTEGVRWSDGAADATPTARLEPDVADPRPPIVPVATNGPIKPAGMAVIPPTEDDPLDPAGLRTRLSPQEQKLISDTVDTILAGKPEDIPTLNPHPYDNRPSKNTGAMLPDDPDGYKTYYARSAGSPKCKRRVIRGGAGLFYYTNDQSIAFTL